MLYLDNDHTLYLVGLRSAEDYSFITTATVTANVLAAEGDASPITGGGPVTLSAINLGSDAIGGTATTPTVVKSYSKFDLEVTVGAGSALELSAGRLIAAFHNETIWKVRKDASILAGADGWIHLEPFRYSGSRPTKAKMTTGEEIEIVDGSYSGTLDKAVALADGTTYFVEYTVLNAGTQDGSWVEEAVAGYRAA